MDQLWIENGEQAFFLIEMKLNVKTEEWGKQTVKKETHKLGL
jgi:hypothetical protein